jgi:hypothetical protein
MLPAVVARDVARGRRARGRPPRRTGRTRITRVTAYVRDDADQDITGIVARKVNLGASRNGVGIRFDTSGDSGCFSESVDANPQIAGDRACFLWMDVWNGA